MIEEKNNLEQEKGQEQQGLFSFDFQATYRTVILNWYWFILSLIICIGSAAIYLRYTTPTYQAMAKLLIKDDNGGRRGSQSLQNMSNIGIISNSNGIDNEMEILTSHSLAQEAVRDLKLYVSYSNQGRVKSQIAYHDQALNVDIDPVNLEKINRPIKLIIKEISITFPEPITFQPTKKTPQAPIPLIVTSRRYPQEFQPKLET